MNVTLQQAHTLFRRNHLYKYEGMQLRVLWHLIMPCLPIVLYNFLNLLGVFQNTDSDLPKSLIISVGISLYLAFSESFVGCNNALEINKNYIAKTGLGFFACHLSVIYSVVMSFLIRYTVIIFLLIIYKVDFGIGVIVGPFFCLLIIVFGSSIGVLTSIVSVFYKDLSNIIQALAFYLLFASGVFGSIDQTTSIGRALGYLPTYIFVDNGKSIVLGTLEINHQEIIWVSILSAFLAVLAITFTRNVKGLMLDYMK